MAQCIGHPRRGWKPEFKEGRYPGFTADLATITWIDHKEEQKRRVAIQCGRHQLVLKPLIGNYPNYKQVIPPDARQMAVIPLDRKPGLIAWLRSLGKTRRPCASTGGNAANKAASSP